MKMFSAPTTARVRHQLLLLLSLFLLSTAAADDWPQWQGPTRDGISRETGLLQNWPEGGPAVAWRIDGLGGGDSAPAVFAGHLYGMSFRDGQEIVWALRESDGKEVWIADLGPSFEQQARQSSEGPGGTPTVDGDSVFVVGMGGRVCRIDREDGRVIWQRSLVDDFGGSLPRWSFRESPLVDGTQIICTPGSNEATLVALSREDGKTIWQTSVPEEAPAAEVQPAEPRVQQPPPGGGRFGGRSRSGGRSRGGAAYSSVIAIDFEGSRQYVQMTAKTLLGVSAKTGEMLWKYDAPANGMGINCSTAIARDGLIFASSAYGNGGGAVRLSRADDGSIRADEVYFSRNMQNHHGGMIVVDGALYGANGGNEGGFLTCIDFQTGDVLWRDRDAPKGALMMADGRLYLRSESGTMMLIEPSREGLQLKGQFEQPDRTRSPAWAHPVVANGRLYIRDQGLLLCYNISAR